MRIAIGFVASEDFIEQMLAIGSIDAIAITYDILSNVESFVTERQRSILRTLNHDFSMRFGYAYPNRATDARDRSVFDVSCVALRRMRTAEYDMLGSCACDAAWSAHVVSSSSDSSHYYPRHGVAILDVRVRLPQAYVHHSIPSHAREQGCRARVPNILNVLTYAGDATIDAETVRLYRRLHRLRRRNGGDADDGSGRWIEAIRPVGLRDDDTRTTSACDVELYDYQRSTVAWMQRRESVRTSFAHPLSKTPETLYSPIVDRFFRHEDVDPAMRHHIFASRGGIVANDVGTGKTIVTIELIARTTSGGPSLIVCTPTLLGQWMQEIRARAPALRAHAYYGQHRIRDANRLIREFDVVVTTSGVVHSDRRGPERGGAPLENVGWQRVVVDEAHSTLNYGRMTYYAICQLRAHARWCLTGTPGRYPAMLYDMMRFLRCPVALSGRMRWTRLSREPLFYVYLHTYAIRYDRSHASVQRALRDARPHTEIREIDLDANERAIYDRLRPGPATTDLSYLQLRLAIEPMRRYLSGGRIPAIRDESEGTRRRTAEATEAQCAIVRGETCSICLEPFDVPSGNDKCTHVFCYACIQYHLRTSTHRRCPLCRASMTTGDVAILEMPKEGEEEDEDAETVIDTDEEADEEADALAFSKFRHLARDLLASDRKTLIFTEYMYTFDRVLTFLKSREIPHLFVRSNMTATRRGKVLREFQENDAIKVFVLSSRCASEGVNLTVGERVVFMEPSLNRHLEKQAIARVDRIGRKCEVLEVVKYVYRDTIEPKIARLDARQSASTLRRLLLQS